MWGGDPESAFDSRRRCGLFLCWLSISRRWKSLLVSFSAHFLINSKDGEVNQGAHLLALAAPRSSFLLLVVAITTPHATLLSSTTILKRLEDFKLNCTGWFYRHCLSTPRHLNPGCIWPLTTLLLYCVLSHGVLFLLLLCFFVGSTLEPTFIIQS